MQRASLHDFKACFEEAVRSTGTRVSRKKHHEEVLWQRKRQRLMRDVQEMHMVWVANEDGSLVFRMHKRDLDTL